ncbi:MAG: hypothetical protein KBT87_13380 [Gammaproteobacteria bacterium]|nr:hypothetical protein [Gammaproteobacteria bacterium]MBQ0775663.1 hypothetical protein [Gammaproteobacteria bacterium]MDF1781125.1 hypothetical protein [Alcanivoracaceae bacterium]
MWDVEVADTPWKATNTVLGCEQGIEVSLNADDANTLMLRCPLERVSF